MKELGMKKIPPPASMFKAGLESVFGLERWQRRGYGMWRQPSEAANGICTWTGWQTLWPSPERLCSWPHGARSKTTQTQQLSNMLTKIENAKNSGGYQRINSVANRLLVRDQGAGGSNSFFRPVFLSPLRRVGLPTLHRTAS
jgi:hypothetical protein